jgi:ubiquinone/menaquinone biosynthesis C-methylase UbiE
MVDAPLDFPAQLTRRNQPRSKESPLLCDGTPEFHHVAMEPISLASIRDVVQNGPTDPINYYRRPLIGRLFRKRINQGLQLLPVRRYGRALEIGFGSGGLLPTLARGVGELHGIDLDADPKTVYQMLQARACKATLVQGSVTALPYPSQHFDLVVCFSVFEHLHKYEHSLREVERVLAPGGLFLLGMPTVNRAMEVMFHAIGHSTINDIHVTTPQMIRAAFSRCGFRRVAYRSLGLPFSPPMGFPLYHNWLLEKLRRE